MRSATLIDSRPNLENKNTNIESMLFTHGRCKGKLQQQNENNCWFYWHTQ